MILTSPVVFSIDQRPYLEATSMGYYKRTVKREKLLHRFVNCIV